MIKPPCQECGHRELGCHGKCERWAEYTEKKRVQYEQRAEHMQLCSLRYSNLKKEQLRRQIIDRQRRHGHS